MNETKLILTDCDGVLLDWEDMFHKWMVTKGHTATEIGPYKLEEVYEIERREAKRLIREFNESSAMLTLPAFRDARSGVAKLVENGFKFIVITSLSIDANAKELRKQNLEAIFGKDVFAEIIALDTGADKDEALIPWKDSGLYWVEDKDANAITGADMGLQSILIEHNHNKHVDDDRIVSFNTWNEIADFILS